MIYVLFFVLVDSQDILTHYAFAMLIYLIQFIISTKAQMDNPRALSLIIYTILTSSRRYATDNLPNRQHRPAEPSVTCYDTKAPFP